MFISLFHFFVCFSLFFFYCDFIFYGFNVTSVRILPSGMVCEFDDMN